MTKTKIICTLGPATDQPGILDALVQEGMSVARFNFSHGNYEEHEKRLNALREARTKYQKPIAALLDTKGPEIRVKSFVNGKVELKPDQLFRLCSNDVEGNEEQVSITCKDLYKDVSAGKRILLDDGFTVQLDLNDGKFYTGSKTKIHYNNHLYKELLNVVRGDVNGDGKVSSADYVKIRKHIMQTDLIKENIYFYAADINNDNKISSADYVKIRKYIMNGGSL